jgi:hypothetical protein
MPLGFDSEYNDDVQRIGADRADAEFRRRQILICVAIDWAGLGRKNQSLFLQQIHEEARPPSLPLFSPWPSASL